MTQRYPIENGIVVMIKAAANPLLEEIFIRASRYDYIVIAVYGPTSVSYDLADLVFGTPDPAVDGTKKTYRLIGTTLMPADAEKSRFQDDGRYAQIFSGPGSDDPYIYDYRYLPANSRGVVAHNSGIPAKRTRKFGGNYVLANAVEDTLHVAAGDYSLGGGDVTFDFLFHRDSLAYAPYALGISRRALMRYDDQNRVVAMYTKTTAAGLTKVFETYWTLQQFADHPFTCNRIFRTDVDGTRVFCEIDRGEDALVAPVVAAMRKSVGVGAEQKIARLKPFLSAGAFLGEPVVEETYDLDALARIDTGASHHRCSDSGSRTCYMTDGYHVSGRTEDADGFITATGMQTIANDVKLPFDFDNDGNLCYLRREKNTEFNTSRVGIYVGDEEIVSSNWQSVTKLYPDYPGAGQFHHADIGGPLYIWQTSLKVLQSYFGPGFRAVVYAKTTFLDHENAFLDYQYTTYYGSHSHYCRMRRTCIRSLTKYYVWVNGVTSELPYQCINREYRLTARPGYTAGELAGLPALYGFHVLPWLDVGFDAAGGVLAAEQNRDVIRIFTDSAMGKLLVGLDVFPVSFRHDVVLKSGAHDWLAPEYDTAVFPWPAPPDGIYDEVSDRKWLLFDTSGEYSELQPPMRTVGGVEQHVQRVNGLAIFHTRGVA